MARLHLKFRNIRPGARDAADRLFVSKPWEGEYGDRVAKLTTFLNEAAIAYGVPAPTLEIDDYAYTRVEYDLGRITLKDLSALQTFHGFRHHLQALGVVDGDEATDRGMDSETDAVAWACSLFYSVRPVYFRKLVREHKIRYVNPNDLLTSETIARNEAEAVAAREAEEAQWRDDDDDSPVDEPLTRDETTTQDESTITLDDIGVDEGDSTTVPVTAGDTVSTAEAAALLGVSTSRVLQLRDRLGGELAGRNWRFSREAVQREQSRRVNQ